MSMDFASAINHFFSFFLPAVCLPVLLWPMARLAFGRPNGAPRWWVQWLVQFAVCGAVLLAGLWVFGRDGKMLTYAALVLACASCQWLLMRGCRR